MTGKQALILQYRYDKKVAGQVVGAMIRKGCDPFVMRKHDIPRAVLHLTIGGRCCGSSCDPNDIADEMIKHTRPDYLYA